jgi:hypothetical protein
MQGEKIKIKNCVSVYQITGITVPLTGDKFMSSFLSQNNRKSNQPLKCRIEIKTGKRRSL